MQINKDEILAELRGSYKTGIFYIYLNGYYDEDLSKMSQKDLGTFFHEYVHFVQNICTMWGMKAGITLNNVRCDLFNSLLAADEIIIPFHYTLSSPTDEEYEFMRISIGMDSCPGYCQQIDTSFRMQLHRRRNMDRTWHIPLFEVFLDMKMTDGTMRRISLGATIVMESMAALCQSLIDPEAEHNDVPYNVVQIYANQHFPNIAADKKKLICICYIALFSLTPGVTLIEELDYANQNPQISGFELFVEFVHKSVTVRGKQMPIIEFFDYLVDGYMKSISGLAGVELDYLKIILDNVRLSKQQVPLLSILNDTKPLGIVHLSALRDYLGIPFMHAEQRGWFFPSTKNSISGSMDITFVVGFDLIASFLSNTKYKYPGCCPFLEFCDKDDWDHCYDSPWLEKGCLMEMVLQRIGIENKKFRLKI